MLWLLASTALAADLPDVPLAYTVSENFGRVGEVSPLLYPASLAVTSSLLDEGATPETALEAVQRAPMVFYASAPAVAAPSLVAALSLKHAGYHVKPTFGWIGVGFTGAGLGVLAADLAVERNRVDPKWTPALDIGPALALAGYAFGTLQLHANAVAVQRGIDADIAPYATSYGEFGVSASGHF